MYLMGKGGPPVRGLWRRIAKIAQGAHGGLSGATVVVMG
jgi:hypothetical protein